MCPLCITTAMLSAAGATSGAGVIAVAANKWRILKHCFRRGRPVLLGQKLISMSLIWVRSRSCRNGVVIPGTKTGSALKGFDVKTGKGKISAKFPGRSRQV